jgi:GNAT superfamily N-acetyltransferase
MTEPPRDISMLIRLRVSLEYQLDQEGFLIPFPNSSEQAWFLVYQYAQGYKTFFQHALPGEVRQRLAALGPQEAFNHPGLVRKLISDGYQSCAGGEVVYWSGYFDCPPETDERSHATCDGDAWVVKVEGQTVCQASSVRKNEKCAEVYVETLPAYRRKGYGRQVVAAWARDVLDSRRVPFYSYRLRNRPSTALANSLRVAWYANVVTFGPR